MLDFQSHTFHASMKRRPWKSQKHEKEARIERISNVFRIVGARKCGTIRSIIG